DSGAPPLARRAVLGRRKQATRELIDIPGGTNLGEGIPLHRVRVEGVEDDIAATRLVEARAVAAVRIGDDGAIPTREDATQQPRNRRGLAGAGGADELEVAGLLAGGPAHPHA